MSCLAALEDLFFSEGRRTGSESRGKESRKELGQMEEGNLVRI